MRGLYQAIPTIAAVVEHAMDETSAGVCSRKEAAFLLYAYSLNLKLLLSTLRVLGEAQHF